jgi:hypothetical protein
VNGDVNIKGAGFVDLGAHIDCAFKMVTSVPLSSRGLLSDDSTFVGGIVTIKLDAFASAGRRAQHMERHADQLHHRQRRRHG